jgi:peptidoglycan L-alanyl-D-glutamate endopeptidase CwlK
MEKLALVHPALADRVRRLFAQLQQEGYDFIVTQGLRTYAEQNALYAKGRSAPGSIVTKAPGGHSQHNFGLAVDVAPENANEIDWNLTHPAWQRMLVLGPEFKLAEGRQWPSFPDNPHLYPAELPATCELFREKYSLGGMPGVWAWFESLIAVGAPPKE